MKHYPVDEWVDLFRGGMTLQKIGDTVGITRERVRQLLNEELGVDGYAEAQNASKNAKTQKWREARAGRMGEVKDDVVALRRSGLSAKDVSVRLGLSIVIVYDIDAMEFDPIERRLLHGIYSRGKRGYTREQLIEGLRRADAVNTRPTLTVTYYARFAKLYGYATPVIVSEVLGAGKWSKALEAAGLEVGVMLKERRPDRRTPEHCWDAVRACRDDVGRIPTVTDYDKWSRGTKWPCPATVRRRLNGWATIIETLRAEQ